MSTVTGPDAGGGSPQPVVPAGAGEPGGKGDGGGQADGGEGHRPGGRKPRTGVFLAAAAGVLVVAAGLAMFAAHLPKTQPPVHPLRALRGTVFGLHTGQCIDTAPNGIGHARAVPCAQPHDAEIYATYRLADRRWPGAAAVGGQARQGCQPKLSAYLNPQLATSLSLSYAYPGQGAWSLGERTVVCEVHAAHGSLTGSVRSYAGGGGGGG
jgi:Septum formation